MSSSLSLNLLSGNPADIHPRHLLANALLCYQYAATHDEKSPQKAAKLRSEGAQILRETMVQPAFAQFIEEVDTFEKQGKLSENLTTAAATEDTCSLADWDGSKMCLLRIARENGDPVEREKAFSLFKAEMIEACTVLNCFSDGQIDAMLKFLCLLDPKEQMREIIRHVWMEKKASYANAGQPVPQPLQQDLFIPMAQDGDI